MSNEFDMLTDQQAVQVLNTVVKSWFNREGFEALLVVENARDRAGGAITHLPIWIKHPEEDWLSAGAFARQMLDVLASSGISEVREWVYNAKDEVTEPQAQFLDPLSLAILGMTLIGAILAARVRKIGSVTFYENIPDELAKVLKSVTHIGNL